MIFKMMKNRYPLVLIFSLLFFSACEKDFEELNTNPFEPTQTELGPLFNGVVQSLTLGWSEQLYLHNENLYKITQQAALSATTFQNVSIGTEEVWERYYSALADIREIENRLDSYAGEQEVVNNIRAMVKVLLAYKTFRVTDLFGDIPFFDAGRGFENPELTRPAFDSQESIYKFLLEELKWVNDNANVLPQPVTASGADYLSLNGFDVLFGENMSRWVKFANSLRLRHAIRMVEKDAAFAEPIIKEILENDLPLIEAGEEVGIWPSRLGWQNEGVHWSFREHKKLRLGSNMWHQMSENDEFDGSGIFDPRVRIFFETNNDDEWAPFPQVPDADTPVSGGTPYQQVRDINHNQKGLSNIYASFNYYLIRDEDYIPELMITAAEVSFLQAEAYLRGLGVAADEDQAKANYNKGVGTSILFWHDIVDNTAIWTNRPPELGVNGEFATINHPNVKFSDAADKLSLIYAQRWIDAFRQPWEAYALGRRTAATPVEGPRAVHYRFAYPPSEAENNPENWSTQVAKMGEDSDQVKIWWIN